VIDLGMHDISSYNAVNFYTDLIVEPYWVSQQGLLGSTELIVG